MDLFESTQKGEKDKRYQPLADRVRPKTLDEFIGQEHILGPGKILQEAILSDQLMSMIFWGPPGTGKTTLAYIIAAETNSDFFALSAVTSGVSEVRKILERARLNLRLNKRTILFIDEIHRFNKAQQDALLHEVEDGTILLIGATTENPSFEVISPLLSRCRVFKLNPLSETELKQIIERALQQDVELRRLAVQLDEDACALIVHLANSDARVALNALEMAVKLAQRKRDNGVHVTRADVEQAFQQRALFYDKKGDYHYDTISAFIKSIRGSDPDAAVYWMARMIEAGEDPKFIARRMIILASEDIGNADPLALVIATAGFTAVDYIGMPEGRIVLSQVATYLASAPKSNAAFLAIEKALQEVKSTELESVPLHLRNAPTPLMEQLGYGKDYKYAHSYEDHFVEQNYLPEKLKDKIFYHPTDIGSEKMIKERLEKLWPKRKNSAKKEKTE